MDRIELVELLRAKVKTHPDRKGLAEKIGKTQSFLSHFANGNRKIPELDGLLALCSALGVDPSPIIGASPAPLPAGSAMREPVLVDGGEERSWAGYPDAEEAAGYVIARNWSALLQFAALKMETEMLRVQEEASRARRHHATRKDDHK